MAEARKALSGPQKVAAFLLSIERGQASQLLSHLADDVLPEVVEAMEGLDDDFNKPEILKELYARVSLADQRREGLKPARREELETLLATGLGETQAAEVLAEIQRRRQLERPFLAIEDCSPRALSSLLERESDAAVAVVLAHLDPALSAAVLGNWLVDRALGVVKRMASLEPPSFEVLSMLASELASRLNQVGEEPAPRTASQRIKTIAELLSASPSELERGVLEGLARDEAQVAREVREVMFTWDDIANVDRRSMQKILGTVETRTLAIALKACGAGVEENITSNLSSRVKDMVVEERELAGALPMAEVLQAREEIMRGVRALIDAGEFKPQKGADELVS
jgi:flagellar motor switch protein FliG